MCIFVYIIYIFCMIAYDKSPRGDPPCYALCIRCPARPNNLYLNNYDRNLLISNWNLISIETN